MSPVRIADDAPEHVRDLRGRVVTEEQLSGAKVATVGPPDRLRLLTYEQVHLLRELWVMGALEDGIRSTYDLALSILADSTLIGPTGLRALEVFTCDPLDDDTAMSKRLAIVPPPEDERAEKIAKNLGGALMRLTRRKHVTLDWPVGART